MSRRPSSKSSGSEDQVRISFMLDRRKEPELAYLFDMEGHGERPRELLRLAQLGYRAEVEMRELHAAARAAQLASLSNPEEARALVQSVERKAKATPARATENTQKSTKKDSEPSMESSADTEVSEVVSENNTSDVPPQPAKSDAKREDKPNDTPAQEVKGLRGFLA